MFFATLLFALPIQQATVPELQIFQQDAVATLLSGEALAADYRQRLLELPPDERIEAIIFLRRSGLLTGKAWRIGELLQPLRSTIEGEE